MISSNRISVNVLRISNNIIINVYHLKSISSTYQHKLKLNGEEENIESIISIIIVKSYMLLIAAFFFSSIYTPWLGITGWRLVTITLYPYIFQLMVTIKHEIKFYWLHHVAHRTIYHLFDISIFFSHSLLSMTSYFSCFSIAYNLFSDSLCVSHYQ